MHELMMFKKEFGSKSASAPTHATIPAEPPVHSDKLRRLEDSLNRVLNLWPADSPLSKILVNVYYSRIVAKSNRVKRLLAEGSADPESSICGARYENGRHVITHYITREVINNSINELEIAASILDDHFDNGKIDKKHLDALWNKNLGNTNESWKLFSKGSISRANFARLIHDSYYVESFGIPSPPAKEKGPVLTTLYQTDGSAYEMLKKIGIDVSYLNTLNDSAVLSESQYRQLCEKAPYLIAMSTIDFSELDEIKAPSSSAPITIASIPEPTNEPIVGVIDTPFDTVHPPYFNSWVEPHNMIDQNIPLEQEDYTHGTCVTSLIVNGPDMNPGLEDGCGHFRVRHFGVTPRSGFSSFSISQKIEQIVSSNPDIHVWNLSLGSDLEVQRYCISPEAGVLDRIQHERNVLFVVAGTNNNSGSAVRVGAPADSLNSLVVNAVRSNGAPASYSRRGPILDFHRKPDVSYYGGDHGEGLSACCGTGEHECRGTSYAAPLIARKAAFLIDVMGIPRDVAKALLIDSARGWNNGPIDSTLGYGIVPIRIEDVLRSANDEIRFYLSSTAKAYETYSYDLPVPIVNGAFPYLARAVLCYAPKCERNQGVDYTSTELDLHFGRINNGKVQSIKSNTQGEPDDRTCEKEARGYLGKWDNVKRICDVVSSKPRSRKVYDSPMWGIKIRKTSRLSSGNPDPQSFGLVITLKEINRANRLDSFVQHCRASGWIVRQIDIETCTRIYNTEQVEIQFD